MSHKRLGVIKWPAAGTRRRISLEAVKNRVNSLPAVSFIESEKLLLVLPRWVIIHTTLERLLDGN